MSLGLQHALLEDANEFLRDHEEEKKRRRKSLSVSGEQARPKLPTSPPQQNKIASPPSPHSPALSPSSQPPKQKTPSPVQPTLPSTPTMPHSTSDTRPETPADPSSLAEPVLLPPKTIAFTEPDLPKPAKAMSSIYGKRRNKITLPGDLGPNDPRRRKSPPHSKSQSPSSRVPYLSTEGAARRRASDATVPHTRSSDIDSDPASGPAFRLEKDLDGKALDSSEDDPQSEEDTRPMARGRACKGRNRSPEPGVTAHRDQSDSEDSDTGRGRSNDPRHGNASKHKSPLQSPSITVTPPITADYFLRHKSVVHPHSAYDHATSAASTPMVSDDEEHLSDVRRAQRLSLTLSPIHSTPSAHRVIRQIVRGDYAHFQHEAEEGHRRQRVYLVATDLSPEAEYALEWTIGTILRDGDTLLALYAVDEEGGGSSGSDGVEIGHGADVIRDTANIVGSLPAEKLGQSPLRKNATFFGSTPAGEQRVAKTKAEHQRFQAADSISDRCIRLLRKTRLQVRVVVEVFHCKSPRHMITEVIDFLTPTLVILGSRGRSALKGVLLGSFSNYLVTKSSVPVMVARRRLKKHAKGAKLHKDGLRVAGTGNGRMVLSRMSNVLEAPGSSRRGSFNRLVGAKVD